jgi:hypothetical protein
MKERVRLQDLSADGRLILKLILQKYFGTMWTGWVGLKMEATVMLLWTRSRTVELCKIPGFFWIADELLPCYEWLFDIIIFIIIVLSLYTG